MKFLLATCPNSNSKPKTTFKKTQKMKMNSHQILAQIVLNTTALVPIAKIGVTMVLRRERIRMLQTQIQTQIQTQSQTYLKQWHMLLHFMMVFKM